MRKLLVVLALLGVLATGCRNWVVEGWATSVAATLNRNQIEPGALRDAVDGLGDYRTVLFNHDGARPIGRIEEETYHKGKMWVKIILSRDEPEIWRKIKDGILTSFSIGFCVFESESVYLMDLDIPGQSFMRIKIAEVSIVSVPANPECRITDWYTEW